MYRYDLLFGNAKTGASDWIVGFVSMEAARAYADQLRNARKDDNIVCTLYARTEEGEFRRYTGDGFRAEPVPEGVKYRYLVACEDGSVGQVFDDRRSAEDFIASHPGLLLRLRAQRADGFAAPSQKTARAKAQAEKPGVEASRQGVPGPGKVSAVNRGSTKGAGQGKPDAPSQGQKKPGNPRSGRDWVAPALAGAAGAGIGAFAANAAFADSAGEGASADPFAAEGLPSEGMAFGEGEPFAGEGLSAAGLGESAFTGEGFSSPGLAEGGAFLGEDFSTAGLGESGAVIGDISPCDDGSMLAGMTPGEDIIADTPEGLADENIAGLGDDFSAEDIAGDEDDEGGLFGALASLFDDD